MGSNLSPDPNDTTHAFLTQLVRIGLGNFAAAWSTAAMPAFTWAPSTVNIRIQSIAFASLFFSLLAAFGAMLGKQWLGHYESQRYGHGSQEERANFRLLCYIALISQSPSCKQPCIASLPDGRIFFDDFRSSSVKREQKAREPQRKIANTVDRMENDHMFSSCFSWFQKTKKEVPQPPVYDDDLEDDEEEEIVLNPVAVPPPGVQHEENADTRPVTIKQELPYVDTRAMSEGNTIQAGRLCQMTQDTLDSKFRQVYSRSAPRSLRLIQSDYVSLAPRAIPRNAAADAPGKDSDIIPDEDHEHLDTTQQGSNTQQQAVAVHVDAGRYGGGKSCICC
ncbi:hypothetical protein CY34DRAFT_15285 [Suillus luteus UH-Slu-Lm8-n1]|uniref:Unplaced genomic scaffold CY34scaffold_282, whole genome shotgun sequence n=1 Tax=Suillus luteus UH-Slu-Lm8-n1 TaxID=930992 RepID=A0A0D0A8P6_9AGAM|nr:hypothetical protein CY34DRAFT_15285 [Suillus luteus UH-Slu-Lm8-n1]